MNTDNTTLTIKTPKKLRDEAKQVAKEMGLPLGTVMNALLRRFVVEKEITVSVKDPQRSVQKSIDELRAGKGAVFTGSTDALVDELVNG